MSSTILFDSEDQMRRICGINDRNIPYLETLLGTDLFVRGNTIEYAGEEEGGQRRFRSLMARLRSLAERAQEITEPEIFMEYQAIAHLPLLDEIVEQPHQEDTPLEREYSISVAGKTVYPKSFAQKKYIQEMEQNQIVFGIGPAGTGKTFLAVAMALSRVLSGARQKIILTRPVVEAGESLGFLPGDLSQKLNPYLRPLYDAMEWLIPPALIRRLEDNGAIEIAPLAYMRGRSLHNACIILDEAQNTTREQMKMFLTRIGENSSAIVTGDITQIDLPRGKESGLVHALSILQGIDDLAFVQFASADVVRSRIIQRIINAYAHNQE